MLDQPEFGRLLRKLRQERHLSQAELAGTVMSAGYLSRLESGARPPTENIVRQLARQLGVPTAVFHKKSDNPEAELLARALSANDPADCVELLSRELDAPAKAEEPLLRWLRIWSLLRLAQEASGEGGRVLGLLEELVVLAEDNGVPELRCRALTESARFRQSSGQIALAREDARQALRIATADQLSIGDTARAMLAVISSEAEAGNLTDARSQADVLLELVSGEAGTLPVEALWSAATVRVRQGDYRTARDLLERALGAMNSHEGVLLWMRLRLAAASLYLQMTPREADLAERCLAEAESALMLVGSPVHRQEFLLLQAQLAVHCREVAAARELCGRFDETAQRLTFRDRLRIEVLHCQLRLLDGDVAQAVEDMEGLAKQAQDATNVDLAAEVWRTLAETLTMAGSPG